jgi:hypothetical protein
MKVPSILIIMHPTRFFLLLIFTEAILVQSCNNPKMANSKRLLQDSADLNIAFFNESRFDRSLSFEIEIDSATVLRGDTLKYLSGRIGLNSGQHTLRVNIKNKNLKTDTTLIIQSGTPTLWIKYFYRPAYDEARDEYAEVWYKGMIKGKTLDELKKKELRKNVERMLENDAVKYPQLYSAQPAKIEINFYQNKIPIE